MAWGMWWRWPQCCHMPSLSLVTAPSPRPLIGRWWWPQHCPSRLMSLMSHSRRLCRDSSQASGINGAPHSPVTRTLTSSHSWGSQEIINLTWTCCAAAPHCVGPWLDHLVACAELLRGNLERWIIWPKCISIGHWTQVRKQRELSNPLMCWQIGRTLASIKRLRYCCSLWQSLTYENANWPSWPNFQYPPGRKSLFVQVSKHRNLWHLQRQREQSGEVYWSLALLPAKLCFVSVSVSSSI